MQLARFFSLSADNTHFRPGVFNVVFDLDKPIRHLTVDSLTLYLVAAERRETPGVDSR